MSEPLQFLLAVLTLLVTPGPTNTVMATAGAGPARSAWPLLLAEIVGYLSIIILARLVLLPLIEVYEPLGVALKLVVVAYLVFAAIRLWRSRLVTQESARPVGPALVFFTTCLNPKGLIFAVSVFPHEHSQLWVFFAAFVVLVSACGFAWFWLGRGLKGLAGRRASILPRVGSVALLGFAALLVSSVAR